ncbi:VWA domain-containing protein [Massilia sp. S19_KUP03_FR1]|uniref:VWA domain-containing protein n=1 Tax=Massilia sp. S19_KUP03_FR1 TaxID=3025503 RepID=UPI002FCDD65E
MNPRVAQWRAAWPQALAVWSKYTRIGDATLCNSTIAASKTGLRGSFAMIRLLDQRVVIDLEAVHTLQLDDYAVEILAHEIGHHVLAPGSATEHFRMLARIRRALPTLEASSAMVANLYTDLLINDHLQRQAGLRMADIYRRLIQANAPAPGGVWQLYLRMYEHLWQLEPGSLGGAAAKALDTDAWLGARLVRVYAGDPLRGATRFAALLLPYLVQDAAGEPVLKALLDTGTAADGCEPGGIEDIDADEEEGDLHPIDDPRVTGQAPGESAAAPAGKARGQARDPFEYGEILKLGGVKLSDHEIAVRYYRQRALPHLVPFATKPAPDAPEPQMEGVEPWDVGGPFDEIDWLQSVLASPVPIPGVTTMRRVFDQAPSTALDAVPVDLDLYVDSSGSMPNPQSEVSWLALAGAIVALSALRAGSSVQVTLWSGKHQVQVTDGFVRDSDAVLRVLTGFFGGGTDFPIHRLRETYAGKVPRARPTHILMISDDGISTMFDDDERGTSGWTIAAQALRVGGAGGTMALNLAPDWEQDSGWNAPAWDAIKRARSEQGWEIHPVAQFEDLLAFARGFSTRHYHGGPG